MDELLLHPAEDGVAHAEFALASLKLLGGTLVVTGRWSGASGRRFDRPTLIVADRSIRATGAHEPWEPAADPWRVEFPWEGESLDARAASIAVGAGIRVPLTGGRATAEPAAGDGPDRERDRLARRAARAEHERDEARRERDEALERLAGAERDRDDARRSGRRLQASAAEAQRTVEETRVLAAQEREARRAAEHERTRVQGRLDECVRAERGLRSALERAQARAEEAGAARALAEAGLAELRPRLEHAETRAATAEAGRAQAEAGVRELRAAIERERTRTAETDAARAEAESEANYARVKRDETLLTFNKHLMRERARRADEARRAAVAPAAPPAVEVVEPDVEIPLGVRRVSAAERRRLGSP